MSTSDSNTLFYSLIIITVFFVFIGPKFPDRLPDPVLKLFLNPYFRALVVFVSIYSIKFNIYFSILVTLLFLIIMNRIENSFLFELFLSNYQKNIDNFMDMEDGETTSNQTNQVSYEDNLNKINKCYKTIKNQFPCNNIDKDNKCCENVNLDILSKDELGNTKNVTLLMNNNLTQSKDDKSLEPIQSINDWCDNYVKNEGDELIDMGCKNDNIIAKCKKINETCNIKKWVKPGSITNSQSSKLELSGTCGAPCKNIHNQVCFDINPKNNKCSKFDKKQCIANKKDCFYLENNQFINSKIKKNNSVYRCKIPSKDDKLPKNCFPVKLYKDSCGNVGMGCWVKEKELETTQPPSTHPVSEEQEPQLPDIKPPKIYFKHPGKIIKDMPTINYKTANNVGQILNNNCLA